MQTNQLHDINWDTLDHASREPQLVSCNYYLHILLLTTLKELCVQSQLTYSLVMASVLLY